MLHKKYTLVLKNLTPKIIDLKIIACMFSRRATAQVESRGRWLPGARDQLCVRVGSGGRLLGLRFLVRARVQAHADQRLQRHVEAFRERKTG